MNISCSCGSKGNYVVHAYYYRCIKAPFFKLRLRILRVRCLICGKTHAVLPIGIVPYSQVPLLTQLDIIKVIGTTSSLKKILAHHPELDESDIYRICSRYMTHWRERLRSSLLDIVSLLEMNQLDLIVYKVLYLSFFYCFFLSFSQIAYLIKIKLPKSCRCIYK